MDIEQVILVNEQDQPVGACEKMSAHEQGLLHRAFSVFIFNSRGRLLLQQRSKGKYHSGGLWTNTCCSHPRPGETTEDAAYRRLQEEMGFQTELFHAFTFTYRAELDKELVEHEIDHVFTGIY
jgi:isopentenyl-diphosphate delta-isomerase